MQYINKFVILQIYRISRVICLLVLQTNFCRNSVSGHIERRHKPKQRNNKAEKRFQIYETEERVRIHVE